MLEECIYSSLLDTFCTLLVLSGEAIAVVTPMLCEGISGGVACFTVGCWEEEEEEDKEELGSEEAKDAAAAEDEEGEGAE